MLKKLNKKGAIALIYVIMIFISTVIVMGFLSVTNKTIAINEVQGIMDVSGVIALRKSVDEVDWRIEKLTVDKSRARNEFINIVNSSVGDYVADNKLLKSFEIQSVNIIRGDDIASRKISNQEYYLEATAVATYSTYNFIDTVTFHAVSFFDFLYTNKSATVAVGGRREDGNMEVIVRTVSRLALR